MLNKFFAAPKAPRKIFEHFFRNLKILSTFFENFGKFVDKNAIKSDFWGGVGRYISKILKKIPFSGENNGRISLFKISSRPDFGRFVFLQLRFRGSYNLLELEGGRIDSEMSLDFGGG